MTQPAACSTTHWIVGQVDSPVGPVPRVSTELQLADHWGTVKARASNMRMAYTVAPGLYAVGHPGDESPVFVSANYKLSFDSLRRELGGRDGWILVLDTKGINVWCAAGKGTFGTDELVGRLEATRVAEVVSHRTLIVPQLGAPGVAAHEVKRRSGFRVVYGPVRARDLPAFLEAGNKATEEMRRVHFGFRDRLVLTPIEVVNLPKSVTIAFVALFFLSRLGWHGGSVGDFFQHALLAALPFPLAFLCGAVLTPLLLPYLPGRAFSVKGAAAGLGMAVVWALLRWQCGADLSVAETASWLLTFPAVSAFFAMNFTGASTYTSLSGVLKEMRTAVPFQLAAVAAGLCLWVVGRFL